MGHCPLFHGAKLHRVDGLLCSYFTQSDPIASNNEAMCIEYDALY